MAQPAIEPATAGMISINVVLRLCFSVMRISIWYCVTAPLFTFLILYSYVYDILSCSIEVIIREKANSFSDESGNLEATINAFSLRMQSAIKEVKTKI